MDSQNTIDKYSHVNRKMTSYVCGGNDCISEWITAPYALCSHSNRQCQLCQRVWSESDEERGMVAVCIHYATTIGWSSWQVSTPQPHQHQQQQLTNPEVRVRFCSDLAKTLYQATKGSAGYDICSDADMVVPALSTATVPTGITIEMPQGMYANVKGRSGLAFKHDVLVFDGVVDSDYRGEIKIKLFNLSKDSCYSISQGDRVAQLLFMCHSEPNVTYAENYFFSPTSRKGGFGSTGQ